MFLDGINRLSRGLQAELFAFLTIESRAQALGGHGVGSVRLITGVSTALAPYVEDGVFDEALYYRLNVIHFAADVDN